MKEERAPVVSSGEVARLLRAREAGDAGVPFLGYRVFPGLIRHQGSRARRPRRLFREREAAYCRGEFTAEHLTACARPMNGTRQFLHAGEALRSEIEL